MTKTIVADCIGKPNLGYVLLAIPSRHAKQQITDLLSELSQELPGLLWPMPPEQLHITLCEIIQPKDYLEDKEALYSSHREQYEEAFLKILSNLPKFTLTFDTVEVSPQAIIVRASDSSAFNSIRTKLVTAIQLPTGTRTPPDITHSSISRYVKEIDLQAVQEIVSRHTIHIDEEVTEFKLVRNEIPPLQKYTVLKTYTLK